MTAQATTTAPRTLAQIAEARAAAAGMLAKFRANRAAALAFKEGLTEAQADLLVVQCQKYRMALIKGIEGRRSVYRLGVISQHTLDNGTLATWDRAGLVAAESEASKVAENFSRALGVDKVVVRSLHMAVAQDIAGQDDIIRITEEALARFDAEELALLRAERAEMLAALQAVASSPSLGGLTVGELERVTKVVANAKREG